MSTLAPGWTEQVDSSNGRKYYWNQATGETQWTAPLLTVHAAPSSRWQQQIDALLGIVDSLKADTAPATHAYGWEELKADDGRVYYWHAGRGEASWTRPADMVSLTNCQWSFEQLLSGPSQRLIVVVTRY